MKRAEWLQETRKMRFEEACGGWQSGRLTQEEAARLLGVCERGIQVRPCATSEACHFLQGESPCLEFKGMNS